jgi:hypothetical protein
MVVLEEMALAPTSRGQLGLRGTTGNGPAAARVSAQWQAAPSH